MRISHILLAILVAAVWGSNFIFVKMGVHEIPPLFLCAVRFFLASIPAIFFIGRPTASFRMVALYGLVMFAMQFSFIFMGIALGMTAGMASLLAQTQIFFSIIFAAFFLQEIPTFWQISGALLSFTGIALAATHLDSTMTLAGFSCVIAGAASWGLGNLITKKLAHTNMIALIGWGSLLSFPLLLVMSLLLEGTDRIMYSIQHFSSMAVVSLLYITYISTWVGYSIWNWLLSRYPVTTITPFTLLIPIFGMAGSSIFMGETFQPWKITASLLVISGLCLNLLVPRLLKYLAPQKKHLTGSSNPDVL